MKNLFCLLLMLCISWSAMAQTTKYNVTGALHNADDEPIMGATVVLLQAADSILYKFAVSGASGDFLIKKVLPGDYILQVTYVGFKTINQPLSVSDKDVNVGTLKMEVQAADVGEVTVEADRVPLEVKKDTIVYNADAYKVKPDAVVEDLLKRLPGVEVEADGTVKAQGEEVKKVYVDGKEFFGDNPQTATKNLPADAIDQVEVFDKLSDMSEFTGVDDGTRDKTINLTLKKDRKKGYFGTVEAGVGTENRYMSKANVNHFNQKVQASVLGMFNNINQQGFGIREYADFMGGFQNIMRGGGRINSNDLGLPISNDLGDGFTTTGAGGLNFNYEFEPENRINVSYFYTDVQRDIEQVINRENFFGNISSFYNQNDDQTSVFRNHNINSTYRNKFNDKNRLVWNGGLGFNGAAYNTNTYSENLDVENVMTNSGLFDYVSDKSTIKYNSNATFVHRFEKRGRSIGLTGSINNSKTSQDALLNSINTYFIQGTGDTQIDSILQDQLQASSNLNYSAEVNFTEPLGKRRYLTLRYNNRNFNESLDKDFFDNENGILTLNDLLSTEYLKDYNYHRGGASFRKVTDKSNLSISLDAQQANLTGDLITLDTMINQSIFRLLPSMRWRYDIKQGRNLSLSYRTSINAPDIEELQPILDNSDPLNLYIGNPNLQPEYVHRASLRFMNFDQFSFTSFFANITGTYTQNKITTARTIDSLFRQISTPVNVQNDMSLRGFASFSTPIRSIGARIRLNTNATIQRGYIFIADVENIRNRRTVSGRAILENRNKEVFDISAGGRLTYNNTTYSINTRQNQTFFTQNYFADLTVYLGENWYVSTDFNYTIYDGGTLENRQEVPIWQASITRYMLKNQRGQLKFTAMDILNRNVGINWESDLNYIQESTVTSLGRYFLVSFRYQIRTVGGKSKKKKE